MQAGRIHEGLETEKNILHVDESLEKLSIANCGAGGCVIDDAPIVQRKRRGDSPEAIFAIGGEIHPWRPVQAPIA